MAVYLLALRLLSTFLLNFTYPRVEGRLIRFRREGGRLVMRQKNVLAAYIVAALAVFTSSIGSAEAAQVPTGRPFEEIVDLINNLQNSVTDL
jgi:hypothetical protein